MSEPLYAVTVTGFDGRYLQCVDDLDHLGAWLTRTLLRMNAEHPLNSWQPRISNFGEVRL